MGQIDSANITTGTIVNTDIATGAGIGAAKMGHHTLYRIDFDYGDTDGSIAVEDRTFLHGFAGTIVAAWAVLVADGSNTDIDFDVQIDGSTALSAVMNITHSTGDNTVVTGAVASGTFTASQRVAATIETVTQNTGATGPRVYVVIDHNYLG